MREVAAEMIKAEGTLSLAVALDRADTLMALEEERQAEAMAELEDKEMDPYEAGVSYGYPGGCRCHCHCCRAPVWYD